MVDVAALIPWLLIAGFWIFVIWAVFALVGVLRAILAELRGISDSLRVLSGRDTTGSVES